LKYAAAIRFSKKPSMIQYSSHLLINGLYIGIVYATFIPKIYKGLKSILTEQQLALSVKRLAHQILENHLGLQQTVLIGIQPRGIYLSDRIVHELKNLVNTTSVQYGKLDITFYRDDVRKNLHIPNATDIPFSIENKQVVIIDDVLWTGRTIRAALDALQDFGRPATVQLCVLIDRRFSRELPIQADYVGRTIDTFPSQKVIVRWKDKHGVDEVVLM
jgi:pyrimidine operon attenuation protein/uracil phosphoribosyltransferase